jgi:hypothetical protein
VVLPAQFKRAPTKGRKRYQTAIVLTAIVAVIGSATASYAGEVIAAPMPPPRAVLPPAADKVMSCRDFRRRPVRTVEVPDLGDAGRAEFIEGMPVIMLDPALLAGLPANLQIFFKLHECGHHVLGHLFAPTDKSEKEADCWAITEGRKLGAFGKDDVIAWKPHFAASRGSKMGHLPGPQRVEFLLGCFEEP